jgi:acetylxylan esterase
MHFSKPALTALLAVGAAAAPLEERQSCPNIHVFGARETTAPAGYGSAGTFVNLILQAYPGSTAEAINYPAQGNSNQAYASSVQAGTQNIANQINSYNRQCPNTKLVVVGYSQVCRETAGVSLANKL